MKFLLNFSLFESLLLDESQEHKHFKARYDLRSNFQFVGGTEGLSEEDLVFARKKILEHLRECALNIRKYKYPRTDYAYTTVFHFGDIVLKKGDNLYYPTLSVLKDENSNKTYEGSVYGAVAHGDVTWTLMIFPRRCEGCKNPIPTEEMLSKADIDMEYTSNQRNIRSYQVVAAEETDRAGNDIAISPKIKIIDLDSPERYKGDRESVFLVQRDPEAFKGIKPIFQISIKTGNVISFLNKEGKKITKKIFDIQNNKDATKTITFFPPQGSPPNTPRTGKIFNFGDRMVAQKEAGGSELREYVGEIIDMPDLTRDGLIFKCKTIGPYKGDI